MQNLSYRRSCNDLLINHCKGIENLKCCRYVRQSVETKDDSTPVEVR